MNVVELRPANLKPERVRQVWECRCGNQYFVLLDDGAVECSACRVMSNTVRCFQPDKVEPTPNPRPYSG